MSGNVGEPRRSGRSRWVLAFRLARREFRRHPWRHALVVLMIAVPVLAAMVAFSAIPTFQHIDDTGDQRESYGADLTLWNDSMEDGAPLEAAISTLPAGSRTETLWTSSDWLVTQQERADGRGPELVGANVVEAPATDGATRFRVDEGRLPRDSTEIFLAGDLAAMGSWQVGDRIASGRHEHEFVVSGTGAARDDVGAEVAVVTDLPASYWSSTLPGIPYITLGTRADAEAADGGFSIPLRSHRQTFVWLPSGTDAEAVAAGLERGDVWAHVVGAQPMDGRLVPALALVFAALSAIVAIVSSAAFAIASRRQLRSVGLLATAGADPATIRAALVLQGAFPGLVAGGLALTAGLVGARFADSRELSNR